MRVLIVKTSSMGDVIHALPAITDMASARPGIEIDWVVEKGFSAIPGQHACVRRVLPLQWRKWRQSLLAPDTRAAIAHWRAEIRRDRYDLVIDMQGLIKSALFACFADGPRGGYDRHSIREPLASLFYRHRVPVERNLHAVDRCRQLAARLLDYPLPDTPADFGLQAPSSAWHPTGSGPYAVLIPCASRPEKLWPHAQWVSAGQALKARGLPVAIFWGSPQEEQRAQALARDIGGFVPPFLTVAQAADTLGKAEVVIGLDTGMSHLAAAHGRPTVGIYCDHEPGLAGLRGCGPVVSLGGKGQTPALSDVLAAVNRVLSQSTVF